MDPRFALLAGAVFVAFATEALCGFGSAVIAITLGAHLYPLSELLALLVPLSCAVTSFIVARHRAHVDRGLLARRVLPLTGAGLAVGFALARAVEGPALKLAFGALVAVFAARELVRIARPRAESAPLSGAAAAPIMVAAGVLHGIYATGGPLLVYAIGRSGLDKRRFRSTLAAVWLSLNLALTTAFAAAGRFSGQALPRLAVLVPVAALAIAAGEWGHRRVDERRFRTIVFSLLLIAGGSIVVRGVR